MLFDLNVSWLAILLAALAYMVMSMIWFHPKMFGEKWARSVGIGLEYLKPDTKSIVAEAFLALIVAFVLALFIDWTGSLTSWNGAVIGFWAFIGFVLTTQYSQVIWSKKPLQAFILEAGCMLATLIIMGALIGMLS